MKLEKRRAAEKLRKQGYSITSIAEELTVSKSSVSTWVRDIELSAGVLREIKSRSHSAAAVEARRISRMQRESAARQLVRSEAASSIPAITHAKLQLVGVSLYWGEGSKKKRGVVEFTNSDPEMIKVMMLFFKQVCVVPHKKFRGHVYLHSHLEPKIAEEYWSNISGIPRSQFHKTSIQHNKNRIQKDTLPYGTFAIVICDTKLKLMIEGWTTGMVEKIMNVYD